MLGYLTTKVLQCFVPTHSFYEIFLAIPAYMWLSTGIFLCMYIIMFCIYTCCFSEHYDVKVNGMCYHSLYNQMVVNKITTPYYHFISFIVLEALRLFLHSVQQLSGMYILNKALWKIKINFCTTFSWKTWIAFSKIVCFVWVTLLNWERKVFAYLCISVLFFI